MIRDKYNIIPVFMALLLHGLLVASLLFVFKFPSSVMATPLTIEASLVPEESLRRTAPPIVEVPKPEPKPEPEPEPEPELPDPDEAEQDRIDAEERMREEELVREQQRIDAEQEVARIKKEKLAEDRRIREEAELERKRAAAEKKRLEDIERQRKENERLRQEALALEAQELRDREIADEDARLTAMNSSEMAAYRYALQEKIRRNFSKPASAQEGIECVINVRQLRGGDVSSVSLGRCNGNDAVKRAIEAAVFKASPLPQPSDPNLFDRDLRIIFKPRE